VGDLIEAPVILALHAGKDFHRPRQAFKTLVDSGPRPGIFGHRNRAYCFSLRR
jgi:hypothetical protein